MKAEKLSFGLRVHYVPGFGPKENGIVRSWNATTAWVVYNCNADWSRFNEYTAAATALVDLRPGWIEKPS